MLDLSMKLINGVFQVGYGQWLHQYESFLKVTK